MIILVFAMSNQSEVLKAYAEILKEELKKRIRSDDLVATRRLLNSINVEYADLGDGNYSLLVGADDSEVAEYLSSIEFGLESGESKPPISQIMEWAVAKNITLRRTHKKDGSRRGQFVKMTQWRLRRFAFGVQKAIHEEGTIQRFGYQGSSFIDDSIFEWQPEFEEDLIQAISKDAELIIERQFNTTL